MDSIEIASLRWDENTGHFEIWACVERNKDGGGTHKMIAVITMQDVLKMAKTIGYAGA